jgi:hypothetical protein
VIGAAATGTVPMVLGDLKPDYIDTVRAVGGQVIRLGRGAGSLNVLDAGATDAATSRVDGKAGEALREEAHGRRSPSSARWSPSPAAAVPSTSRTPPCPLRLLRARHRRTPPVLSDLVKLLGDGPEAVRIVTLDRGDDLRYRTAVDGLQRSLLALLDGPLGFHVRPPHQRAATHRRAAVALDVGASAPATAPWRRRQPAGAPAGDRAAATSAVICSVWRRTSWTCASLMAVRSAVRRTPFATAPRTMSAPVSELVLRVLNGLVT